MSAIFKREFSAYFTSPIGYIYLAVFYLISGFLFYASLSSQAKDLSMVFGSLFMVLMVLIPILTMRLFSEDKRYRTDQALLTAPIGLYSMVLGKFLAAFAVFTLGLSITLLCAFVLSTVTTIDWLATLGNFVGIFLLASTFIAIGILTSALTENQIIAAVGSFVIILALMNIDQVASIIPVAFIADALASLSIYTRYYEFTIGIFNLQSIIFFISIVGVVLFLTAKAFERKRWS